VNLLHGEHNLNTCLTHKQVVCRLRNQANQAKHSDVVNPTAMATTTLLLCWIGVADGVQRATDTPDEAERRRGARIAQATDQQRGQRDHVVLEEVVVGALRAVEEVQRLLAVVRLRRRDLLRRRVLLRVRDLGFAAEPADAQAVPHREEEGARCREEDVAASRRVSCASGASGRVVRLTRILLVRQGSPSCFRFCEWVDEIKSIEAEEKSGIELFEDIVEAELETV